MWLNSNFPKIIVTIAYYLKYENSHVDLRFESHFSILKNDDFVTFVTCCQFGNNCNIVDTDTCNVQTL